MISTARATTESARRYMIQLCKHWGHKFEVVYDDTSGRIALPVGPLTMAADETGLTLTLEVEPEGLDRIEPVVTEHLNRFAFREPFDLAWLRA
jgi:hypothetical protein